MQAEELVLRINDGYKPTDEERRFLSGITELNFRNKPVSSLEGLSGLSNLQSLYLSCIRVSSLEGLRELTNLRTLVLQCSDVGSLKGLNRLPNLQALFLYGTQVNSLEELSKLTNLQSLDLSYTQISSLEGISELKKLQALYLYGTQVSSLERLGNLTNLKSLLISGTNITSLEVLSVLTNLRELSLVSTKISSLKWLSSLINLQTLSLKETEVSSLNGLSSLTNLQALDLAFTKVSSLKELSSLTNLQALDLAFTKVSSLDGLSELKKLHSLNLCQTQISSLEGLKTLTNLNRLYISGMSLDHIPRWLVEKNLCFKIDEGMGNEPGVYMNDVQLSEQPVSLFSQPRELIEAYYQEQTIPINEAKVIFLGEGEVGKTYTIYRIEHGGEEPKKSETTPGINITKYERKDKATINFWDFGGQAIQDSIHRCFLTDRTCYVVVVSNRRNITTQARYWLKTVESLVPYANVILAVNQWEGVADPGVDEARLKNEFKTLNVEVKKYNAREANSIKELAELIDSKIKNLPGVKMKFPESWYKIIQNLRKTNKSYVTKDYYDKICDETNVLRGSESIRKWLLEWFNDLGVCFSTRQDDEKNTDSSEYMVLEPVWFTNAVYLIVNNCRNTLTGGKIARADVLEKINDPKQGLCVLEGLKYNKEELNCILGIMHRFHLSYEIDKSQGIEFIPSLYSKEVPGDVIKIQEEIREKAYSLPHIQCEIDYKYLPNAVVHRLMMDCVDNPSTRNCWFYGFTFGTYDELTVICEKSEGNDVLHIDIFGKDPEKLFGSLMKKVERINEELKLTSRCYVCSEKYGSKKRWALEKLLKYQKEGKFSFLGDDECNLYEVEEVLGNIVSSDFLTKFLSLFDKYNIPSKGYLYDLWEILDSADKYGKSPNYCLNLIKDRLDSQPENNRLESILVEILSKQERTLTNTEDLKRDNQELMQILQHFNNEITNLSKLTKEQKEEFCKFSEWLYNEEKESNEKQNASVLKEEAFQSFLTEFQTFAKNCTSEEREKLFRILSEYKNVPKISRRDFLKKFIAGGTMGFVVTTLTESMTTVLDRLNELTFDVPVND